MDDNLINQFAFEIFSRVRIFEAEFKVFQAEQKLANLPEEHRSENTIMLNEASINHQKQHLEELKAQIEQFRQQKQINK